MHDGDVSPETAPQPLTGTRPRAKFVVACQQCGDAFEIGSSRLGTARFCSRRCYGLARRSPEAPCPRCGTPVSLKPSDPDRRFCSIACRDAGRRVTKPCQVCAAPMSLKASEAKDRLFCSRSCMQSAWSCAFCAKIRPTERRDDTHCSDRCALLHRLEQLGDEGGERRACCGRCKRILPVDAFHKERANRNGLSNRCKDCTREKYQQTKVMYRERRYAYHAVEGGKMLPFTEEQRAARFSMWGGRCWICGVANATEEDHVKPISQAGWHALSNLRPICHSCNARKRGTWPLPIAWSRANFKHPAPSSGSEERRPREPRVDFTCPVCGETTNMTASAARKRRTCSRECGQRGRTLPLVTLTCRGCGKSFEVHNSVRDRRFYCSQPCFTSSMRGARRRASEVNQPTLW